MCLYAYKAWVTRVYDGDTVTLDIQLGFGIEYKNQTVRLSRINAPEVRGVSRDVGLLSRDYLRDLILGKQLVIETERDKKGKYGRYLAEAIMDGENINDKMVSAGHAEYQEY